MGNEITPARRVSAELRDRVRKITGTGAFGKSIEGAQGTIFDKAQNRKRGTGFDFGKTANTILKGL